MPLIQVYSPPFPTDDDATADRMHRRLRTYLEDSGIGEVQTVRADSAPEGARGVGDVALGAFTIVLTAGLGGVTSALTGTLIDYVRRGNRSVTVKANDVEVIVDVKTAKKDTAVVAKLLAVVTGEEVA